MPQLEPLGDDRETDYVVTAADYNRILSYLRALGQDMTAGGITVGIGSRNPAILESGPGFLFTDDAGNVSWLSVAGVQERITAAAGVAIAPEIIAAAGLEIPGIPEAQVLFARGGDRIYAVDPTNYANTRNVAAIDAGTGQHVIGDSFPLPIGIDSHVRGLAITDTNIYVTDSRLRQGGIRRFDRPTKAFLNRAQLNDNRQSEGLTLAVDAAGVEHLLVIEKQTGAHQLLGYNLDLSRRASADLPLGALGNRQIKGLFSTESRDLFLLLTSPGTQNQWQIVHFTGGALSQVGVVNMSLSVTDAQGFGLLGGYWLVVNGINDTIYAEPFIAP